MDNLIIPESEQDKLCMVGVSMEYFEDDEIFYRLFIHTEEELIHDGLPPTTGWQLLSIINMLVEEHPVGIPVLDTNLNWVIRSELNEEYLPLLNKVSKAGGVPSNIAQQWNSQ